MARLPSFGRKWFLAPEIPAPNLWIIGGCGVVGRLRSVAEMAVNPFASDPAFRKVGNDEYDQRYDDSWHYQVRQEARDGREKSLEEPATCRELCTLGEEQLGKEDADCDTSAFYADLKQSASPILATVASSEHNASQPENDRHDQHRHDQPTWQILEERQKSCLPYRCQERRQNPNASQNRNCDPASVTPETNSLVPCDLFKH